MINVTPTTAAPLALATRPGGIDILDPDCPVSPAEFFVVLPLVFRVVDGRVLFELQARDSVVHTLKAAIKERLR